MPDLVGERIREARIHSDLTQRDLAGLAGISHALVSLIEKGKRSPSPRVLRKIAIALGLPADAFREPFDLNLPAPSREFNLLTPVDFEAKVVGVTSAGKPTLSPTDYLESLSEVLKLDRARHFLVTVASETINSVGFRQGDTVVVDSRAKPVPGSVVFAGIEGMPVLVRLMSDKDLKGVNVAGVVVYVLRGI